MNVPAVAFFRRQMTSMMAKVVSTQAGSVWICRSARIPRTPGTPGNISVRRRIVDSRKRQSVSDPLMPSYFECLLPQASLGTSRDEYVVQNVQLSTCSLHNEGM